MDHVIWFYFIEWYAFQFIFVKHENMLIFKLKGPTNAFQKLEFRDHFSVCVFVTSWIPVNYNQWWNSLGGQVVFKQPSVYQRIKV